MTLKEKAQLIYEERLANWEVLKEKNLLTLRNDKEFFQLESSLRSLNFSIAKYRYSDIENKEVETEFNEKKLRMLDILNKHSIPIEYIALDHLFDTHLTDTTFSLDSILNELIDEEIKKGITTIDSFEKLKPPSGAKALEKDYMLIYKALNTYAVSYPKVSKKHILFTGSVGIGKTFAITVLKNYFLRHKKLEVLFLNAQELSDRFWKIHLSHLSDEESPFLDLIKPDILIIDDLGTEPFYNNVTEPYLYYLVTSRVAENKALIITSNLGPEAIEQKYGERILSRVYSKEHFLTMDLSKNFDARF